MELTELEMTDENLRKIGYEYDYACVSWYSKTDAEHRFAFPPFGFTKLMLHKGLKLWVDENNQVKRFSFGDGGTPANLLYI